LNGDLVVPYLQNKLNGFCFCLNLPVVRQRKPVVQCPTSQISESTSSAQDSHGANRGPVTTPLRCSNSAPQISNSPSSGQGGADDDCHDPNNGQATNSVRSSSPTSQISESSSSAQDSRGTDNGRVLTHPRRSNSASQISNSASSGQGGADDDSHDPNNDQATHYVRSSYSTPQFHISKSARSGQDGQIAGNGQDTTPLRCNYSANQIFNSPTSSEQDSRVDDIGQVSTQISPSVVVGQDPSHVARSGRVSASSRADATYHRSEETPDTRRHIVTSKNLSFITLFLSINFKTFTQLSDDHIFIM